MVCGLQNGGVFSEDSLPYTWKWSVHATAQIKGTVIGDVPPKVLLRTALSAPIVHRGVQSPTWKNTVPPKEPIPTWNDIT